jgi:tripartite-type tricarboxylate transporter receptor subunit TctC
MRFAFVLPGAAAVALVIAVTGVVEAQQWPTRPVRVVSPFPAGSASDTTSRVVVDYMSRLLGRPMPIESRPGAGGRLGFAEVAKAEPDGYTLVTSSSSMASGVVLHRSLPYDPARDFVHVAAFGVQPNVLVASTRSGFRTLGDLVAAAKAKPGTLTFASAGIGSTSHMAAERLRLAAKIDVRHIPFREGGLTEVLAGRIDFYFLPLAAATSALATGKLTVLAVSTPRRAALLPDVPSLAEAGYPDAESSFWLGLSAPAGTPREIVNRLNALAQETLQTAEVKSSLAKIGVDPVLMDVEQFGKFVDEDLAATLQLARDAHIEPTD